MKRYLGVLLVTILIGSASAVEFGGEGDVVVTADGSVVGAGEFENGNVELELLAGFSGFATLTVVDESGTKVTVEVMIGEDASVLLSESLEDLRELVAANGGELTVTVDEHLDFSGNMAFGAGVPDDVELPEVALDGMAKAKANHEAALEHAEDGRSSGGDASAEARARAGASAGEDADAEAEADVAVGIGLGSDR